MRNKGMSIKELSVERFFGSNDSITFEGIMNSIIKEKLENTTNSSYDDNQVNVAIPIDGSGQQ